MKRAKVNSKKIKNMNDLKKKGAKVEVHNPDEGKAFDKVTNIDFILEAHNCDICSRDISKSVTVLCATCGIAICLQCLANGKEKADHKRTDDYFILDRLRHPLFCHEWSALEELKLIRGIEKFGVDNWAEIADYLGTKTSNECEVHYYSFYYKTSEDKCPNPEDVIIQRESNGEIAIDNEKKQSSLCKVAKFIKEKQEKENEEMKKKSVDTAPSHKGILT
jgi:transcriptional adapter 2-alpha